MKYNFKPYLTASLFSFLMICMGASGPIDRLDSLLHSLQQQYAPDRRTAVFNISYKKNKTEIVLSGEVEDSTVKSNLIRKLQKIEKGKVTDSILVLPDPNLGNNNFGIIISDVADVKPKPNKNKKLSTQALMGAVVKLLKKTANYYYIQMTDGYLGWIDTGYVYRTDQAGLNRWNSINKVIVITLNSSIYKNPGELSESLSGVVAGCILKSNGTNGGWTSVELANGRSGFINDSAVQNLDEWKKSRQLKGSNLEKTAKSLLGIRYRWGGTSVRCMDCSGFVKTVYRLNGMELQRDADQQSKQGVNIEPGENFQKLRKGDLLFFGRSATLKLPERITHVGIYLENGLFIHSSGNVHYSSFYPSSKYYDPSLLKRFVRARRLF